MRNLYIPISFIFLLSLVMVVSSCKKSNNIDNDNILQRPYSLFVADKGGSLYVTNDGDHYRINFPVDGYIDRSLIYSGLNILFVKNNTHISTNNGVNFNVIDSFVQPRAVTQQTLLDVPDGPHLRVQYEGPRATVQRRPRNNLE